MFLVALLFGPCILNAIIEFITFRIESIKLQVVIAQYSPLNDGDKTWSTGKGNGKPLQDSCLEDPKNSMKRQKDGTLKDELPRSVGAQYAIGDQRRNNTRKNEETEPKQKQHPVVDVTGDGSKVQCCKEQYCIGTWDIRSMNQGKFEVVKQEMQELTSTFQESVNSNGL